MENTGMDMGMDMGMGIQMGVVGETSFDFSKNLKKTKDESCYSRRGNGYKA